MLRSTPALSDCAIPSPLRTSPNPGASKAVSTTRKYGKWTPRGRAASALGRAVVWVGAARGTALWRRGGGGRVAGLTGSKSASRALSIHWSAMRAGITPLLIQGRDPGGTETPFPAEEVPEGQ